jgi:hypothetical protein
MNSNVKEMQEIEKSLAFLSLMAYSIKNEE